MTTLSKKEAAMPAQDDSDLKSDYTLDCGWGRLIFGQTFSEPETLIQTLREELPERRDIAVYIVDPHVVLANAPQEIFLDPSHTFRLDLATYRPAKRKVKNFVVRPLESNADAEAVNRIYAARKMVVMPPEFFSMQAGSRVIHYLVAEDERSGEIVGTVTGVDHAQAFGDPEKGSSLWCLAVDPQARHPGVGEALVRALAELLRDAGALFMDLSVMHDNEHAIALYEKLGFVRVPVFSIKRKNPINEQLFTGPEFKEELNPYAQIIIREARRRGIHAEIIDAEGGFFRLSYGGRSVQCRESLSELTSAIAMSMCDDKAVTRRIVARAGVLVPEQMQVSEDPEAVAEFLERNKMVVVKPARGEQGRGVAVGLSRLEDVMAAIDQARRISDEVLVEQYFEGQDLRLVVINYKVVAAAIRRPAAVIGDGRRTVRALIEAQSRRRAAATGGESRIPLDGETERTLLTVGYTFESVLPEGKELFVRKTANLHTGGTIHDVTDFVHSDLVKAGILVARAVGIPVVGVDLMVKSPRMSEYVFIEANERPGLANHEPQPTAERFIDLLFPLAIPTDVRQVISAPSNVDDRA